MSSEEQLNTELESFRRQWISDLRIRNDQPNTSSSSQQLDSQTSRQNKKPPVTSSTVPSSSRKQPLNRDDDQDFLQGRSFDEPPPPTGHTLAGQSEAPSKELVSALDHFEEAMEREAQGNMGDSLKLYRKAYKVLPYLPGHTARIIR